MIILKYIEKIEEYQKIIGILENSIVSLHKSNVTVTDLRFKIRDYHNKINILKENIKKIELSYYKSLKSKDNDKDEVKDDKEKMEEADLEESDGYTGKAGKGSTGFDDKVGGSGRTGYDAGSKALQERFQKLANIIK